MFQIVEGVERQGQKIPRAACGVEHGELPKPLEKRAKRVLRPFSVARCRRLRFRGFRTREAAGDTGYRQLPLGQQRANDHRINDPHNLVPVRIVRTELRSLVRVEASLEQSAQDRRIDVGPVESGRFQRNLDLSLVQR